ncbi:DoxX family protein [Pseudoalteromonas sp. L23]|uniref:DoxX family protein n=1 Tax=unclassified Pseudoalteromonas TaxID=194690 RepID=UPI001EF0AD4A|nr:MULTISPECIES: DoxX family protein [unclassified Pseudoalteromonas]MCF7513298.1 DoxX family protein [Pseudoalteromonas sp. L7]MCF7525725.1 DoxX family protein [Pseudoalteromonas sp. L23]MCX2765762.1 DoxX family protein [Pseudoalteromonas sp. B530]
MASVLSLFGRVGLSAIFILAVINKIQYFEGDAAYMASSGLPSELLPLVIAFELIGGLFILAGAFTQLTAIAFAGFSIVSALLFHFDLADQIQFLMFFKNIAVAGGFLALAASGAGKFSIDSKLVESK